MSAKPLNRMKAVDKDSVIDRKLFGVQLREARKRAGYTSIDKLVEAIEEKIGYQTSKRHILRIENGEAEPNLSLLVSLSLVLYGDIFAPSMVKMIDFSRDAEWKTRRVEPLEPVSEMNEGMSIAFEYMKNLALKNQDSQQ